MVTNVIHKAHKVLNINIFFCAYCVSLVSIVLKMTFETAIINNYIKNEKANLFTDRMSVFVMLWTKDSNRKTNNNNARNGK